MLTLTKDEIENSVYRNSDLKRTALELYDKLEKAEAELAEFKADIALLLDQKDDYQEKLFEENEALKAEIEGLKKIIAAVNSTASMAHYGGYIRGYIK